MELDKCFELLDSLSMETMVECFPAADLYLVDVQLHIDPYRFVAETNDLVHPDNTAIDFVLSLLTFQLKAKVVDRVDSVTPDLTEYNVRHTDLASKKATDEVLLMVVLECMEFDVLEAEPKFDEVDSLFAESD